MQDETKRGISMAKIGTMFIYPYTYYNDKMVEDMTKAEKDAMIAKYEARGYKCVIVGYNDKENQ
jgi:hypothetical protein